MNFRAICDVIEKLVYLMLLQSLLCICMNKMRVFGTVWLFMVKSQVLMVQMDLKHVHVICLLI